MQLGAERFECAVDLMRDGCDVLRRKDEAVRAAVAQLQRVGVLHARHALHPVVRATTGQV